ncbi:MAG TPA: protein translocase subunit SecD [Terriglobales bacterium]|jgi:preprotein translocase subunit SecD|nr:protein translocase subunit SecD [Terriglobales bacterium]
MKKNLVYKSIFIVALLLVFLYGILGIPKGVSGNALLQSVRERIHLGLDLEGGTHLILQVMVNDAVNAESDRAVQRLKDQLKAGNVAYGEISKSSQGDAVVVRGVTPEQSGELRRVAQETLAEYDAPVAGAENSWTVAMKPQQLAELKNRAVQQAIETIRTRIDQLGVSEPVIEEHGLGEYQILVQLPGVDDPTRVKQIMQSTAMLEIRQSLGGPYATEQDALSAHGGVMPADAVMLKSGALMKQRQGDSSEGDQFWLVSRTAAVSGRDLRTAEASRDEFNRPAVKFDLTGDGGRRFASFTGSHVGDSLAVILDNKVQQVATIQEQIRDQGRITGGFTEEQAKDIAMTLRSGALPAGIRYLEERTVGPSLGADSIRHGVTATIIGLLAVMIFMLFYYRGAGINADLALILNLVILLGFLGFSGATLTLPGIAGVILTVGMGVDSNVLIFERIKEELSNGKTAPSAVEQGFGRAWTTILDTHVTTIVSAIILFIFGTGPVRGFAVTLTFGLLANLFTAVYVSRVIFDAHLNKLERGGALSI